MRSTSGAARPCPEASGDVRGCHVSDAPNARSDESAPEVELDGLLRRMQDRIKKKTSGGPTTQSGLDLANELVKLDRKAREIETTLTKERDTYAARARDLEEKMKK